MIEEAFWHTFDFLELCARKGITLKPEKFKFCRREAEFVGFHLDWDTYRTADERLTAIRKFSMPEHPSITEILVRIRKPAGALPCDSPHHGTIPGPPQEACRQESVLG